MTLIEAESYLYSEFKKYTDSINDIHIRNILWDKSILAGGAISSLLLDEPVNDLDLYLMDIESVEEITKYYVKEYQKFKPGLYDIDVINNGSSIHIQVHISRSISHDLPIEQYDYSPAFISDVAVTLNDNVQISVCLFGTPKHIQSNIDFIHCQAYWVANTSQLIISDDMMNSILNKNLILNEDYPISFSTLTRIDKMLNRGWNIKMEEYLKLSFKISMLDLTEKSEIEKFIWLYLDEQPKLVHMLHKGPSILEDSEFFKLVDDNYKR